MSAEPTWIALESDHLTVAIDPHGAQLSTLRTRSGEDLLWNGDPAWWTGRAPLLFPVVGMLAGGEYRLDGRRYRLPRHGFARDKNFTVEVTRRDAAEFSLRADPATLAVYPFQFELVVSFELSGAQLTVTTQIKNAGDDRMPASFGYHPALRWPLPQGGRRTAHYIGFEQDEPAPIRRIDADGLMLPSTFDTPVANRRLALTDDLFRDDVIILERINSRKVVYGSDRGPAIEVELPDARYLGIWSKPGAGFICIEPWHGLTDPVGFTGDFLSKPGVFTVPPQGTFRSTMSLTLVV